jgi:hypothetical protein
VARIETDPNYSSPTFSRATAGTDIFKKEDVQSVAAALSTHDHSTGKGLVVSVAGLAAGSIAGSALADGGVTSAKIADGTIVAADLADAGITNAKLGPDVARANLLTNGGFEIWQRGNGPFTASAAYCADRWQFALAGSDTLSISKDTTHQETGSACAAATFTLGTGAGATQLYQLLYMSDGNQLAGRTVSLSVRLYTGTANAVRIAVQTAGTGGTTTYSAYHSGGNVWQTLTVTVAVPTTATGVFPAIYFSASCGVYIDSAMLVVGSQAANYVPLHPADDLARCLRYYEILGPGGASTLNAGGIATGAGQTFRQTLTYLRKAVTPTVTKSGTWALGNASGQPTVVNVDGQGFLLAVSSAAAGDVWAQNSGAGACITAEANP